MNAIDRSSMFEKNEQISSENIRTVYSLVLKKNGKKVDFIHEFW